MKGFEKKKERMTKKKKLLENQNSVPIMIRFDDDYDNVL